MTHKRKFDESDWFDEFDFTIKVQWKLLLVQYLFCFKFNNFFIHFREICFNFLPAIVEAKINFFI